MLNSAFKMVRFRTPNSLLRLYVSVYRGNQPTLSNLKYVHAIVNTLGSVVNMYTVPSLNNLCRVSQLEHLTLAYWHYPT